MIRYRTFTTKVPYNYFEVGSKVTPVCQDHSLEFGKVYTVTECNEPMFPDGDLGCTFVEGHTNGLNSEYLKQVETEE